MSNKTSEVHVRIQPHLKQRAEAVFAQTGYSPSEAIQQFYAWTARHNKIPIRLHHSIQDIPCFDFISEEV